MIQREDDTKDLKDKIMPSNLKKCGGEYPSTNEAEEIDTYYFEHS